jgi:aminoglycoside phosphotransferase family enzyme/predicted kinase
MQAQSRAIDTAAPPRVEWATEHPPIIAALLRPEAFPHRAEDIVLHETHISWVVLAGPFAYKIKKPVDLGFLDFTTRQLRRIDCENEVRLNRRLCPDVYLGVVDIVERDGAYFVGGAGRPVEPAVWMRRLAEQRMLPQLLAREAVSMQTVRRIARQLAEFHAEAATGAGVDEYGSIATITANWDENFSQTARFVGATIAPSSHAKIADFVARFLSEHRDLFAQRVAEGRIREGHGDLHAASICVEPRRIRLFDCLEFEPRFRCSDVAAEVAFLAMDLDHNGRADLAAEFVDEYVRRSGDEGLRNLLELYTCYRAYVRGKVECLRLDQPGRSMEEQSETEAEARAYFDLAWAYAGGLRAPTIVVTMGLPASGKTTLARGLARHLGLVHLSSDVVRKALVGARPTDRRRATFRRGIYRQSMTRRTYATLRRRALRWLRRGQSVVIDATFGQVTERAALRRLAARAGARLHVLVCQTDEETICQRLIERETDPLTASDARLDVWPDLRAAYSAPDEIVDAVTLDTMAPPHIVLQQALDSVTGIAEGSQGKTKRPRAT